MNDKDDEYTPLLREDKDSRPAVAPTEESLAYRHRFLKYARFVSAEVVVFCYTFVITFFQNYTQQYIVQWYAIEALKNVTFHLNLSNNSYVCYTESLVTDLSGSNSTFTKVEKNAAHMNLMVTIAISVTSLVVNLVVSPLSDSYGRKPALILVLTSGVLSIVVSVIATYLNLSLLWFILSGFLLGIGGGASTLWSVSYAYVSDIATKQWRTFHLGFLQAMIYIAVASSAGVVSIWLDSTNCDFRPPCWLMLAIVVAGWLYVLVMPESLPKEKHVRFSDSKRGVGQLSQGVKIFFWPRLGYNLWKLWFVSLSLWVVAFSEASETVITLLFQLHKPLEWSRNTIGVYGVVRAVAHTVALFLFLPLLLLLKVADPIIAILGVISAMLANLFIGFVSHTWEMFLAVVLQGVESLLIPVLLGMNSKLIRQEDQGALYSILSTVSVFAALLGSMAYSLMYPFSLERHLPPGSSFWLMAIIWTIPIPFMLLIYIIGRKSRHTTSASDGASQQHPLVNTGDSDDAPIEQNDPFSTADTLQSHKEHKKEIL